MPASDPHPDISHAPQSRVPDGSSVEPLSQEELRLLIDLLLLLDAWDKKEKIA
jgi:hypothetical protein